MSYLNADNEVVNMANMITKQPQLNVATTKTTKTTAKVTSTTTTTTLTTIVGDETTTPMEESTLESITEDILSSTTCMDFLYDFK